MAEVVRDKRMSVSQRALFSAITEFEKYPEFLNEVTGAKIIKRPSPDKVHVQFEIEVVKKVRLYFGISIEGFGRS